MPTDPPQTLPFVAVLYDMDGTLVDTEPLWQACERDIMAGYGLPWGAQQQAVTLGTSTDHVTNYMADLVAESGQPRPDPATLAEQFLQLMADHLRTEPPSPRPGVERLLAEVERAGVPTALVSSSSRALMDAVLDSIGGHWFQVTVSANDVARHKPDPLPYVTAATQLGIDPEWALAIEDSPTGTASATAAGSFVVVVQHLAHIEPGPRRRVVDTLADVSVTALADWFVPPTRAPRETP